MPQAHTHLERAPIRPNDPLSPLHKPFLVPDQTPDLDDVARDGVVEDLHRLPDRDAAREELDEVARFEDRGGVVGLAGGAHGHGAVDEVEGACYSLMVARRGRSLAYVRTHKVLGTAAEVEDDARVCPARE